MKTWLSATVGLVVLAIAAPAVAADMPVKAIKAPPVFSWTGFYFGVNAGGALSTSDFNFIAGPGWFTVNRLQLGMDGAASLDSLSPSGGGQAGYNWQIGSVVFGVEADIQYIGLRNTNNFRQNGPLPGLVTPYTITETTQSDWMATARGRLGLTYSGSILVYGTAGAAFANSSTSDTLTFPTLALTGTGARSNTQTGWVVGGGFEWAMSGAWSAKAEYLYARFPTATTGMTAINGLTQTYTDHLSVMLTHFGINYRFGG